MSSLNRAKKNADFHTFIWYLTFVKSCFYWSLNQAFTFAQGLFCPIELSGRNDRHNDMDRVDVCFGNNDGCSICSGNDKRFLKIFISKIFVFPIELIPKVRRHPSRKQFFPFCRFAVLKILKNTSDSDNRNYSTYNGQKLFGFFPIPCSRQR